MRAAVAADDLVASVHGTQEERGDHAEHAYGLHEFVHGLVVVHAVGMVRERVEQIHAHLGHIPVVRVRDRAGAERAGQVAEVEVHRASSPMIHGMTSSASRR